MEVVLGGFFLLLALSLIAGMYASVGHGGASGYLAILSLTVYASNDSAWLKQHAWSLNLLVAGLAFSAYRRSGFFNWKLTGSFVIASIPAAIIGGLLKVNHDIYDILLSITLVFAAWRLLRVESTDQKGVFVNPPPHYVSASVGAIIGFLSGIIGVGGGIFLSPIILLFRWADPKTTAGVAAAFIWVNSAAGLVGNSISGQLMLEYSVLIPFACAVFVGGFIGSKFGSDVFSQKSVRRILVTVLLLAALKRIVELVMLLL